MRLWHLFLSIICFFYLTCLHAQEHVSLEKYFLDVEQVLQSPQITLEDSKKHRQYLRKIQQDSHETIQASQKELAKEKELLKALGEKPDSKQGQIEDKNISLQREKISQSMFDLDSRIKQNQLFIAKSQDLYTQLSQQEQQKLTAELLLQTPKLHLPSGLTLGFMQTYDYAQQISSVHLFGIVSMACVILGIALTYHLAIRDYFPKLHNFHLDPLSKRLVLQCFIASYFICLFRFHIIEPINYPYFKAFMQLLAGSILSCGLYELWGKIHVHLKSEQAILQDDTEHDHPLLPKQASVALKMLLKSGRLLLLLSPMIGLAGYTEIVAYVNLNIFIIFLSLSLFILLRKASIRFLEKASDLTGQKNHYAVASPVVVMLLEPLLAIAMAGFALLFWGFTSDDFTQWLEQYQNGIKIGQLSFNFNDIGAAILSFTVVLFLFKGLKWFLNYRIFKPVRLNIGIKNAILTIIGYVGVILAFISAAGALGLDTSNFALVAGALSVGIGFGLQTIFSNFISGLILLFERPFKVGDWVGVGEYHGLIKRIRVRSTELETFSNLSIIIPNSKMISDVVTNWTLYNLTGRVEIAIGVDYKSDIDAVETILLACANNHPDVCKEPAASVFFMNFGGSSLDFELRCFIKNIAEKNRISSEIRKMILTSFRTAGITIPYPKTDIYVKSIETIPEIKG